MTIQSELNYALNANATSPRSCSYAALFRAPCIQVKVYLCATSDSSSLHTIPLIFAAFGCAPPTPRLSCPVATLDLSALCLSTIASLSACTKCQNIIIIQIVGRSYALRCALGFRDKLGITFKISVFRQCQRR